MILLNTFVHFNYAGLRERRSFSKDSWRATSTGSRTSRRPTAVPALPDEQSRVAKHAWYFHIQNDKSQVVPDGIPNNTSLPSVEKEAVLTSSGKLDSSMGPDGAITSTSTTTIPHSKSWHSHSNDSDQSQKSGKVLYRCIRSNRMPSSCNMAHVPYHHKTAPFAFMRLVPCQICKRKWVPETVLSTVEPPPQLEIRGRGQFLEARICRNRV